MDEQQRKNIQVYCEEGFRKISESDSPFIFNVSDPVYLRNGNKYAVFFSNQVIFWDHSDPISRNRILTGNDFTIVNPGTMEDDKDLE